MRISARTRVFALLGHPVRHSLSPSMYNTLFPRFGVDAVYVALDVHPAFADRVADGVRTLDLVGVNLTVPFKERVLPHLDQLTVAAREAGAANVVINIEGELSGYNTDGEGLVRCLEQEPGGISYSGLSAMVIGAGGTGRAVISALLDRGARRVVLLNRTTERAEAAVDALEASFPDADVEAGPLEAGRFSAVAEDANLVVNCTSGEGARAVAALEATRLPAGATWVDVNYWMPDPPHADLGRAGRLRYITGHGMLAHQGALAFELFTGHPVDASEILSRIGAGAEMPS